MPGRGLERRHISGEGSEREQACRAKVREETLIRQGVTERADMLCKRSERRHISGEGSERGQASQTGGQRGDTY